MEDLQGENDDGCWGSDRGERIDINFQSSDEDWLADSGASGQGINFGGCGHGRGRG